MKQLLVTALLLITLSSQAQFRNTNRDYHPKWVDNETLIYYSLRPNGYGIYTINTNGKNEEKIGDINGSHPVVSPDGKYIVYSQRTETNRSYLHLADAKTGEFLRVLDHQSEDRMAFHPDWTPDGKIIFNSEKPGFSSVMIVNTDGSGLKTLIDVENVQAYSPTVFEDGKKFIFTGVIKDRIGALYTANIDGSDMKKITNGEHSYGFPHVSPDNKKIVGQVNIAGAAPKIFLMNIDGTGFKQLTTGDKADFIPQWSPDGKRVAFATENYGFSEIAMINADGTGIKNITSNGIENAHPFYKDSKSFVFSSRRNGFSEIYQQTGKKVKMLTNNKFENSFPVVHNASDMMYYVSKRDGHSQLVQYNLKTKRETVLTSEAREHVNPTVSPDGKWLAFESNSEGNDEIYLMNLETKSIQNITNSSGNEGNPTFHPNGKSIYLNADTNQNYDIFRYDIETKKMEQISGAAIHELYPAISPDGSKIVYCHYGREAMWDLYIMNADGSGSEVLTAFTNYEQFPQWSPDSQKVIFQSTKDGSTQVYEIDTNTKEIKQLTTSSK